MKRRTVKRSGSEIAAAVVLLWWGMAAVCLGGGSDSALQKNLRKVFKEASGARPVKVKDDKSESSRLMEVLNGEALIGYGAEVQVVSRSGPFFIAVAVSPDEKVLEVQIPRYPHQKGRGVRKKRFLGQFTGVPYGNPLILGEQVDAVSGATSSSTAVTDGVRKALLLVHEYRRGATESN